MEIDGNWVDRRGTAADALHQLAAMYDDPRRGGVDRTPGRLSQMLQQLAPDEPLAAEVHCALMLESLSDDFLSPRRILEDSLLAQLQTRFTWNTSPLILENMGRNIIGKPSSYEEQREIARAEAQFCVAAGHTPLAGSTLVWGAGAGYFAAALEELGAAEVVAIEPDIQFYIDFRERELGRTGARLSADERAAFDTVLPWTGEQLLAYWPNKKFSSVIASNFHPEVPESVPFQEGMEVALQGMARMVAADGKAVIGISSTDPYMTQLVAKNRVGSSSFTDFTVSPCGDSPQFTNFRAVNGQVAYVEYRGPKT
jgi:hypothetical protein